MGRSENNQYDQRREEREKPFLALSVLILAVCAAISGSAATAHAEPTFPYVTRTRPYSGYSTTVRGDLDMIGRAGATLAIPNTISSLEPNPAGLTMTMGSVSAQISSNSMRDRAITGNESQELHSKQWGLAVIPNRWGFAFARYTPSHEEGRYQSPNTGTVSRYEMSLQQYHLSVSRAVFARNLSLGASLVASHVSRNVGDIEYGDTTLSYKLGAIYHFKNHFLIGASFSPAHDVGDSSPASGGPDLPGFAQPLKIPAQLSLGLGWIPNRFFTAGFSVTAVGKTSGAALLRDQSVVVGDEVTYQPRLGVSYILAQYHNLKISAAAGSYYENLRIRGVENRLHGTFTLTVNPWFVNTGVGVDRARGYKNVVLSLGIDIVRFLRTFDIIPPDPVPPYRGFLPHPTRVSADGLPPGITHGEEKRYFAPSTGEVTEIISDIPKNVQNVLEGEPAEHEKRANRKKSRKRVPRKKPSRPPSVSR